MNSWFHSTFFALENKQYRLMWTGTLFSFLGMQMQVITRGYLAYELTGRNSALGAVTLAFGVPQLMLSLVGGVIADRLPKRTVLWVSQSIIAVNSAWVATMIAFDMLEFWQLILAGFIQGACFSFVGPARQAFIGDLVGRERIANAVVLQQLSMNGSRVVGPSIAGAFLGISFIGAAGVYYMTTLGFVIAIVSMIPLPRGNPRPRATETSPMADIMDGLRYLRGRPQIAALAMTSLLVLTIGFPYQSFLASVVLGEYGATKAAICWLSSAGAVARLGARAAFCDIDPLTFNLDPSRLEAAITPRTKAIMPVDQIGLAADIPAVLEIARRHGLKVIEDAAPSLGATAGEARVGAMSDFTCFSFHPRKSITSGEGGMITTNDDRAAEYLRCVRSHGASTSDLARHTSGTTEIEEYRELGYNYRMTDIQGAVGTVQMGRLEGILAARGALAQRYDRLLAGDPRLETPYVPGGYRHTYQSYCVRLNGQDRAAIMASLAAKGIASRRGVMAIHLEPWYRERWPDVSLPETEAATANTLLLPLYAGMTEAEQDEVADALRAALA